MTQCGTGLWDVEHWKCPSVKDGEELADVSAPSKVLGHRKDWWIMTRSPVKWVNHVLHSALSHGFLQVWEGLSRYHNDNS